MGHHDRPVSKRFIISYDYIRSEILRINLFPLIFSRVRRWAGSFLIRMDIILIKPTWRPKQVTYWTERVPLLMIQAWAYFSRFASSTRHPWSLRHLWGHLWRHRSATPPDHKPLKNSTFQRILFLHKFGYSFEAKGQRNISNEFQKIIQLLKSG